MTVSIEGSTLVVNANTPHEKKYSIAETISARPITAHINSKTPIQCYGVFVLATAKIYLYLDEDAARFHDRLAFNTIYMTLQVGNGKLTTID
jgi:hypothetical protein